MKKWFENIKISKKLMLGFLFISVLGIIIGIIGVTNLIKASNNQQASYDEYTLGIKYASASEIAYLELKSAVRDLYIHYDTEKEQYNQVIVEHLDLIESKIDDCSKVISNDQDQANFDAMKTSYESYKNIINEILEASKSGKPAANILASIQGGVSVTQATSEAFGSLTDYKDSLAQERISADKTSTWTSIYIMIGIVVISLILSLLLSRYISGSISNPMSKFAAFAEMLAVGDIDVQKVVEEKDRQWAFRKDEVGMLASSFEKMIATTTEQAQKTVAIASGDLTTSITVRSEFDILGKALSELVLKFHALALSIVSSANQVDAGTRQVAASSTSLSQGATEQASSVEELTASLSEVTSQTTHNAQNAHATDDLAKTIKKNAETGNSQMEGMLLAMDDINLSSGSISKIIKVIEDIAFQTNILALNAAVEAARAGQYGKGFAVVAEEVRNLAARSAEAAKETTGLIEDSIRKVGAGTKIAGETAGTLGKIVEGISQVSELVGSIALDSNEQASALEQINQGITEISHVIQNNAAAAEESAAASEELSTQADNLKENVSIFKLNTEGTLLYMDSPKPQDKTNRAIGISSKASISLSDHDFGKY